METKGVFKMAKFKTAHVKFEDEKYNYSTSINPNCTDQSIKDYFVGKKFNMGRVKDDLQLCIGCEIDPPDKI